MTSAEAKYITSQQQAELDLLDQQALKLHQEIQELEQNHIQQCK